jgi:hypothetical protein
MAVLPNPVQVTTQHKQPRPTNADIMRASSPSGPKVVQPCARSRPRSFASKRGQIDLDKMIAARKAGASPWDLHERAVAGEFAPPKPFDQRTRF